MQPIKTQPINPKKKMLNPIVVRFHSSYIIQETSGYSSPAPAQNPFVCMFRRFTSSCLPQGPQAPSLSFLRVPQAPLQTQYPQALPSTRLHSVCSVSPSSVLQ